MPDIEFLTDYCHIDIGFYYSYRFLLSVSFCSIMCLAEHLTVVDGGFAAFAPGCNVVGIHLFLLPDGAQIFQEPSRPKHFLSCFLFVYSDFISSTGLIHAFETFHYNMILLHQIGVLLCLVQQNVK